MKPPNAILRMEGHIIAIYMLVTHLMNVVNIDACINLLQYLGFTTHPTKFVVEPKQTLVFLGFCINLVKMTVKLTVEIKNSLHEACNEMIVSSLLGIKYGG